MKNVLIVLLVVLTVAGCVRPGPDTGKKADALTWSIIKSPQTGKCYEVASLLQGYKGYMGMAEIPCQDQSGLGRH